MEITSTQNPRYKHLLQLLERKGRRKQNRFIAEGQRACSRAIYADLNVLEIWHCPELAEKLPVDIDALDCHYYEIPVNLFKKASYLLQPEGILLVCESPPHTLDNLPTDAKRILVAVGSEKPGNLGAMARTAQAAGFDAMIAAGTPIDSLNPNAIRASTGAVFDLPIAICSEEDSQSWLMKHNITCYCAYVDAQAKPYQQIHWNEQSAIIIGPEDTGLSERWRTSDIQTVYIPQAPGSVDSLNASVAAGILCYASKTF